MDRENFNRELKNLINRYSMDNTSNTPDHVLANYLIGCLENFDRVVQQREVFYGRDPRPSAKITTKADLKAARKLTH